MLTSAVLSLRHLLTRRSPCPIRHPCTPRPTTSQRSANHAVHHHQRNIHVSPPPSPHQLHRAAPQLPPALPNELLVILNALLAAGTGEHAHQTVKESSVLSELFQDREKVRETVVALAQTRLPQRATQLLRFAHGLGCQLKQNAYEGAAHHLAMNKHWYQALVAVDLGIQHTQRTTIRLLNWRIRALLETQNYATLDDILSEFDRYGIKPNRRTFHLLIAAHIRNHNLTLAKERLRLMHAAGYTVDASTYALVTTVYRILGIDPQVATQAVKSLPSLADSVATAVLNSLLQMYFDAGDLKGAYSVLSLFHQSQSTTPIMIAFRESIVDEDRAQITDVDVSSNPSLGLPPIRRDAGTFSILINHTASRKDRASAMRYLQVMLGEDITPTIDTVVSLTHLYFATGDEAAAIQSISDMCGGRPKDLLKQLGVPSPPVPLPFSVVSISPTVQAFNALIKGLLHAKGIGHCNIVLKIMRSRGVKPNPATFEIILRHLDRRKHARPRELLRVLRSLTRINVKPSLRHLHIIMRAIFRREKRLIHGSGWNVAAAKFSAIRRDLAKYPTGRISGLADIFEPAAGIQLTARHRYRFLSRPIIQSLTARHIRSDAAMIALRVRHDAVVRADLDSAREVFNALLARGMRPRASHFAALMEGHAFAGDILGAEGVMEAAVRAGLKPNVVMFTILIVGHARKGKPQSALRTFHRMVLEGIKPDVPSIDAVVSGFFVVGSYIMARRVLTSLWSHIAPFPDELNSASLKILVKYFRALHPGNLDVATRITIPKERSLDHHRQINELMRICEMQPKVKQRYKPRLKIPREPSTTEQT
ncbi:hypothetical protein HGRIS_007789 [Hohenbuehelia grisea]|uniref:Pentatricopeptide repeat-containing protein n=1 Tax=Hohenbuehelia grisea TaxID=104357 RepID=A0ABR3J5X2_9AGAR